jgi:Ca-activated chloride channel family protein
MFALFFLIVAFANPQIGTRYEEVKREGQDIVIALDVSLSMKAEDIKPNRLEKAKHEIGTLIEKLQGDRIGLIVFAGEAYVQFPITTDYSAANLFLDAVDVDVVPIPGTAIGSAMDMATKAFLEGDTKHKVLIIITDGENNQGDAIAAAEEAIKKGIVIYAIGMGSPSGTPIPIYDKSGSQVDFKRDREGNPVVSKLDEISLEKIAAVGGGKYYRATNNENELDAIYRDVSGMEKKEFGKKQFTEFEDRFQYSLGAALLFLILESLISEKKNSWLSKLNFLKPSS